MSDIYIEKTSQAIDISDGDKTRLFGQVRYDKGERVGIKIYVQVGAASLGIEFGDYAAVELANWLLPTMRPALDKAREDGIALNRIADELVAERDALRSELVDTLIIALSRGDSLGYVEADRNWVKRLSGQFPGIDFSRI